MKQDQEHPHTQEVNMSHRTLSRLLLLFCMSIVSENALAQDNLARAYTFTPKQGMSAGFVTALAAHVEWRKENGDPWQWRTLEIVTGDEVGSFIVRSGDHTWADFDAYDAGFGPQGSTHFGATVTPLLESMRNSITIGDTTNVRWPEDDSEYTLFQLVRYKLIPDRVQQFNEAVTKIHNAVVQQDYPAFYTFISPFVGGMGPVTTLVLPYRNWAGLEAPEQPLAAMMAEVYGAEEAASIFTEFASCYTEIESLVVRRRPDLSVLQDPGM
jgi:hypothetical protein